MKTKINEILTKKGSTVFTIGDDESLLKAVKTMNKNNIGSLIVLDKKNKITGIITERDVLRIVDEQNGVVDKLRVSEAMTSNLIIGVPSDDIGYLMGVMTKNRVRHLPVMDGEKIAGLISIGDLVESRLDDSEFENRMLSQYIQGG